MKKRIITAIVLAGVLLPLVFIPVLLPVLEIIFLIFAGIALWEMLHMYETRKEIPIGMKIICFLLMYLLFFAIISSIPMCNDTLTGKTLQKLNFKLDIPIVTSIIILTLLSSLVFLEQDANDIGKYFLAIFYVGGCFSSLVSLRGLGARFIVYILLITVCTDIFALVFGLLFGKHKMAPRISPKKTWEGAIGGTTVATIIGSIFAIFYPIFAEFWPGNTSMPFFTDVFDFSSINKVALVFFIIFITLAMSIFSQVGDLIASKLKRTYGIKDFSNVFPGHGGVLDRFDSLIFAAPMFILAIQLLYHIFPNLEVVNTDVAITLISGIIG